MKRFLFLSFISMFFVFAFGQNQEGDGIVSDTIPLTGEGAVVAKQALVKEEKNRNVMLNANSNTMPRNVNIGLPFTGDMLILENDVPVVYNFWPTIPVTAWRYDNSLEGMGLLSFGESALTFGKVGYTVNSSDRDASNSFKGYASFFTTSYGTYKYDATITSPLGKGWGIMLSMHENYSRGNGGNYMFTTYTDRAEIFKAGISKKYKNGKIRILYKYSTDKLLTSNYYPFQYDGDGKTSNIDNFNPGKDSYVVGSGIVPVYDPYTGDVGSINLADDENLKGTLHSVYLIGNHKFNRGWNLKYTSMFQSANNPFTIQFPISLMIHDPDQQKDKMQFKHLGTDKVYDGSVQMVMNQNNSNTNVKTVLSRIELNKKINGANDLRI